MGVKWQGEWTSRFVMILIMRFLWNASVGCEISFLHSVHEGVHAASGTGGIIQ